MPLLHQFVPPMLVFAGIVTRGISSMAKKNVQYRYLNREVCGLTDESDETLMSMIRTALGKKIGEDILRKNPKGRIANLERDEQLTLRITGLERDEQLTLLNRFSDIDSNERAFSGQLVVYRPGMDVPTIVEKLEEGKDYFDINRLETGDESNKPIEGVLYFVVMGDHVGLIASQAVRGGWLERYLTWLLNDMGQVINGNNRIELNAGINLQELPPIQEMRLCAPANESSEERSINFSTICKMLTNFGFGEESTPSLRRAISDGKGLEGVLSICIKQGRQKFDFPTDTLAHAFRNVDPENLVLIGPDGKLSHGMFYLSQEVQVRKKGSWLDGEDAIQQIIKQMNRWVMQGRIDYPVS